jgi:hypothetical protein
VPASPDPKQGPRVIDADASAAARLSSDECAACGGQPGSVHHVVQKGAPHFGDDVPGNLLVVCGTGTTGCHGAYHGSPYVVEAGRGASAERRDSEWVRRRIGDTIRRDRPDVVEYVLGKLGDSAGRAFLERDYYLVL